MSAESARAAVLAAEITRIGMEGFDRGYAAAVDMLAEPIYAQWLAQAASLPLERAEAITAELRGILAKAADR